MSSLHLKSWFNSLYADPKSPKGMWQTRGNGEKRKSSKRHETQLNYKKIHLVLLFVPSSGWEEKIYVLAPKNRTNKNIHCQAFLKGKVNQTQKRKKKTFKWRIYLYAEIKWTFVLFFFKRREEIYGQFYNIRIILNWIGVEGAPSGSTLDIVVTEKRGKKMNLLLSRNWNKANTIW